MFDLIKLCLILFIKGDLVGKQKSQSGSAHLIIIIVLALALIGTLGFVVWQNFINKNEASQQKSEKSGGTTTTKDTSFLVSVTNNNSKTVSFSYPSDWNVAESFINGVSLKSSDFTSDSGNRSISNGSVLYISGDPHNLTQTDSEANLLSYASGAANGEPDSKEFINVDGQKAIKFTFSGTENNNSFLEVIFIKDGVKYTLEQEYKINSDNPYPELMSTVTGSLKVQ